MGSSSLLMVCPYGRTPIHPLPFRAAKLFKALTVASSQSLECKTTSRFITICCRLQNALAGAKDQYPPELRFSKIWQLQRSNVHGVRLEVTSPERMPL